MSKGDKKLKNDFDLCRIVNELSDLKKMYNF